MRLNTIAPQHLMRTHTQAKRRKERKKPQTRITKAHRSDAGNTHMSDRQLEEEMTCQIRKESARISRSRSNYVTKALNIATEWVPILLRNQEFQSSNLCSKIGNVLLVFLSPCSSAQLWKLNGTATVSYHVLSTSL